jgi:hypothetical protein
MYLHGLDGSGAFIRLAKLNRAKSQIGRSCVIIVRCRKATPKPDKPEEYRRFLETAREVGADQPDEAFDRVLDRVARPKPAEKPMKRRSNFPHVLTRSDEIVGVFGLICWTPSIRRSD